MAVSPAIPAGVRAELFLFSSLGLDHRFTTVRAETVGGGRRGDFDRLALNFRSQSVPAAECFDRILGNAQCISNLRITAACFPHCGQAAFFLWCHQVSLQSLKWFTFLRPKVVSFYSAKNKKRPPTGNNSPVAVNVAVAQVLANIT